jgi:hypothetical protein
MDLNIAGNLNSAVTVNADINFGNYVSAGGYLGGIVNDYVGTIRPTTGAADQFIPYFLNAQAGFGMGSLTVGRIPVQYTPYTLKLIDVDSYTYNNKTDSGNYPLDGGAADFKFGSVGLNAFAAKTNQNAVLGTSGLVSQPTAGLYAPGFGTTFFTTPDGTLLPGAGRAAGGLVTINQTAGARLSVGTPFQGNLGLTYLQAAGPVAGVGGVPGVTGYDSAEVFGADLNAQFGVIPISLNYTQTRTRGEGVAVIDDNTVALDGNLGYASGKFGIVAGYRSIGNNFGAPGYWAKIGRWTNPTNIQGPYANLSYGIAPNLSLVANGDFYKGKDTIAALPTVINDTDDQFWRAEGGLKWGFLGTNSVNLGIEYVRWPPSGGLAETTEQYINIGLAH